MDLYEALDTRESVVLWLFCMMSTELISKHFIILDVDSELEEWRPALWLEWKWSLNVLLNVIEYMYI